MQEYFALLIMLLFAVAMTVVILCLNLWLGPKKKTIGEKAEPYECGVPPIELPAGRFSIKFYMTAMLFVAFDVEILFLYLWAVRLRHFGWYGLLAVIFFLAVLGLGLAYAWRKGALQWK
jgi:NADH-quinone oxidoreductase subunit A